MKSKTQSSTPEKKDRISLAPLEFEEVLADLLQIKPVENEDLKKDTPKRKKSKLKTKK